MEEPRYVLLLAYYMPDLVEMHLHLKLLHDQNTSILLEEAEQCRTPTAGFASDYKCSSGEAGGCTVAFWEWQE